LLLAGRFRHHRPSKLGLWREPLPPDPARQPTTVSEHCGGERPSARLPQTCPNPLSVPGGQGVADATGKGDQRTKLVLCEQQPEQQRQHTASDEHGLARPRHPRSARRTGLTRTASIVGEPVS